MKLRVMTYSNNRYGFIPHSHSVSINTAKSSLVTSFPDEGFCREEKNIKIFSGWSNSQMYVYNIEHDVHSMEYRVWAMPL